MIDANVVSLETAGLADAEGLSDLLAHYVAELSPLFAIQADADGRFRYDTLPLYWTEPDRRFAFSIRSGQVGCRAAFLLWDRLPGHWVVRVSQANSAALPFWRHTVQSYTGGAFTVSERPGRPAGWYVFSFRSASAP